MFERILIVDDDVQLAKSLEFLLKREGYHALSAHHGAEARRLVSSAYPDVILLDLGLPDVDGITLMGELRQIHQDACFLIVTANTAIKTAVAAMRNGATDYLTKPFEAEELTLAISRAIRDRIKDEEIIRLRKEARPLPRPLANATAASGPPSPYPSKSMRGVLAQAKQAADRNTIVLLLGESGAGKDYVAKFIHECSPRAGGPFFSINCAAVSSELAESELFGHEPGAFTGARGRKRGLLELADQGTLLLNEVGDLPPPLQAKLLTFLDTKEFTRVGGQIQVLCKARIIAATNRNLEREVAGGRFRADLYYRLNVFSVTVPPLRERVLDIPLLVRDIVQQLVDEMGFPEAPQIDGEAMDLLCNYHWPGNVRELRNVLERALILCSGQRITPSCLTIGSGPREGPEWSFTVGFPSGQTIHEVISEAKGSLIAEALRRSRNSKQGAAKLLGISRHALAHQMKFLAINE